VLQVSPTMRHGVGRNQCLVGLARLVAQHPVRADRRPPTVSRGKHEAARSRCPRCGLPSEAIAPIASDLTLAITRTVNAVGAVSRHAGTM
jgi:hypothetical protein